eukprot:s7502_g3.t1
MLRLPQGRRTSLPTASLCPMMICGKETDRDIVHTKVAEEAYEKAWGAEIDGILGTARPPKRFCRSSWGSLAAFVLDEVLCELRLDRDNMNLAGEVVSSFSFRKTSHINLQEVALNDSLVGPASLSDFRRCDPRPPLGRDQTGCGILALRWMHRSPQEVLSKRIEGLIAEGDLRPRGLPEGDGIWWPLHFGPPAVQQGLAVEGYRSFLAVGAGVCV